ncbi:hypothetical protein [Microbacterium amylolyticum]|uniref:Glycine cleavage system aminomethyltransferase T n=1 Tax=Microbacterium amylolyticum TaxID=936337 RepID=A0ABS4ZJQ1_9MICO|nr:hypothetical protein [Microbacterium amylolyticum]MBP2437175.1 glycine cleavage system aminomethyltransferase T [Microbacterium amylolyticum]
MVNFFMKGPDALRLLSETGINSFANFPVNTAKQFVPTVFPVRAEFSNWRSEQRAWRESVAFLDQSHHMTDLFITGADALRLLSRIGVNSFANFGPGRAKQFVAVNHEGFLIGDAILFHLDDGEFDLVGHPMVIDWVQFHGETGDEEVSFMRDGNSLVRDGNPALYRYEIQGPRAMELMESVGESVRDAIVTAGAELGLVLVGSQAYSSANLESAWVPSPLPAIFSGQQTAEYRSWLPAERAGSLAGSFTSDDITDFYLTPYDLGYDRNVAFDHDFIGRSALEEYSGAYSTTPDFPHCMWSYMIGAALEEAFTTMTEPTRESFMTAIRSIDGLQAPLMLDGTSITTTEDGQPAVSTVVVRRYNGQGYDNADSFE